MEPHLVEPHRREPRRALITGVTGQDGSYLAELLLAKGYEVHGLVRSTSSANTARIDHLHQDPSAPDARFFLHDGELSDTARLMQLLVRIEPHEVYNLAGQSHVATSFERPEHTGDTSGIGAVRILESIRASGLAARFYQASSSEMFGASQPAQNEQTPFRPISPYGVAKVYAHQMTRNYRETYGMFAVNGIAFSHESPRRGEDFLTTKVSRAVARIQAGLDDYVYLGDLDGVRDWGYAPEYVYAMWQMLQADEPADLVLATGVGTSVGDFVAAAFDHAGLDWEKHVRFDPRFVRPATTASLIGDPTLAAERLGWSSQVKVPELAGIMVDAATAQLQHAGRHWIDQPQVSW